MFLFMAEKCIRTILLQIGTYFLVSVFAKQYNIYVQTSYAVDQRRRKGE